jgi:hypothetical protein
MSRDMHVAERHRMHFLARNVVHPYVSYVQDLTTIMYTSVRCAQAFDVHTICSYILSKLGMLH